jgi:hypothetical protein
LCMHIAIHSFAYDSSLYSFSRFQYLSFIRVPYV